MIRHHYKFVYHYIRPYLRCLQHGIICNLSKLIQAHDTMFYMSKNRLHVVCTDSNKIKSFDGIIVTGQPNRFTSMNFAHFFIQNKKKDLITCVF